MQEIPVEHKLGTETPKADDNKDNKTDKKVTIGYSFPTINNEFWEQHLVM